MKKYFLLVIYLISIISYSNEFLTVNDIKREYEIIQKNLPGYKKTIIQDTDTENGKGEIIYYYDNNKLKAIAVYYFRETGKLNEEIYFVDNYPIFVVREKYKFNYPTSDKRFNNNKTKLIQMKYYFDSNRNLINYVEDKDKIIKNTDKLQEKSIEIKNEIVRLLKLRSKEN